MHKLRVAIRRAQTALAVCQELVPDRRAIRWGAALQKLQRRIGSGREWDVFIAGERANATEPSHPTDTRSSCAKALRWRKRAANKSAADFRRKRFHKLILHLQTYSAQLRDGTARMHIDTTSEANHRTLDPLIATFANELLTRYFRRFEHKQLQANDLESHHLHVLRIRVKELRYVAEFFQAQFAVQPLQRLVLSLSVLQDQLGEVHDFHVAQAQRLQLVGKRKHSATIAFKGAIDSLAKLKASEQTVQNAANALGVLNH